MREFEMKYLAKLSTEDLERLLTEDASLPENEQIDEETVLYILQIIEDRGVYDGEIPSVESAKESFDKNYMPEMVDKREIIDIKREKRRLVFQRAVKSVLKTACIAVVTVVLLFTGTMTAEAAGYNVYGKMAEAAGYNVIERKAHWDENNFYFGGVGVYSPGVYAAGDFDAHPDLEELQLDMLHDLFNEDVLITYIPEGYKAEEYKSNPNLKRYVKSNYKIELFSENNTILVTFADLSGMETPAYPKDPGEPEILEFRDIEHYIMRIDGKWQALWKNGTTECCISGVESREELIKMVESVYARPKLD